MIFLEAGKPYYIEAINKEGTGKNEYCYWYVLYHYFDNSSQINIILRSQVGTIWGLDGALKIVLLNTGFLAAPLEALQIQNMYLNHNILQRVFTLERAQTIKIGSATLIAIVSVSHQESSAMACKRTADSVPLLTARKVLTHIFAALHASHLFHTHIILWLCTHRLWLFCC